MDEEKKVLVRVQRKIDIGYGRYEWGDELDLDVTFDEFMDTVCRAAHRRGKSGLDYERGIEQRKRPIHDEEGNLIMYEYYGVPVSEFDWYDSAEIHIL